MCHATRHDYASRGMICIDLHITTSTRDSQFEMLISYARARAKLNIEIAISCFLDVSSVLKAIDME